MRASFSFAFLLAALLAGTSAGAQTLMQSPFTLPTGSGGGVSGLSACTNGDALADNELLRAHNTNECQGSTATLTDAGVFTLAGQLNLDNLRLDGNTLSSQDVNGHIGVAPNGTGDFVATLDTSTITLRGPGVLIDASTSGEVIVDKGDVGSYGTLHFYTGGVSKYAVQHDNNDVLLIVRAGGTGIKVDASGYTTVSGRLLGTKGADVASAADVALGNGNVFDITGTTTINTISATGWTAGSVAILQFDASVTVAHNAAGTGASILLAGAANFSATAGDTLTLVYDGATWRETARAVI